MKNAILKLIEFYPFTSSCRGKYVFILRDWEIEALHWLGDSFGPGQIFPQTDAGLSAFDLFLDQEKHAVASAFLLADMTHEELHTQTIPRLRGSDRRGAMERRVERIFRQTPFRRIDSQGRLEGGAERVLFSGLTAPHLVQPWIDALRKHGIAIAGLWSVPLLSRALLRMVSTTSKNALLVSLHVAGQRQTYFHMGRTLVSRLIPCQYPDSYQTATAIHAETERTRLYLNGLRLLTRGTPLDVYVPSRADLAAALQSHTTPARDCLVLPIPLERLAVGLKLVDPISMSMMDRLFAQHLLTRTPANHYAPRENLSRRTFSWLPSRKLAQTTTEFVEDAGAAVQTYTRVGDVLLEKGAISQHQLEIALTEQKRLKQPLGKVLIILGFIAEEKMRDLLGAALEQESVDLNVSIGEAAAVKLVPKLFAQRHNVLPLTWQADAHVLTVAMANTFDMATLDKLQALLPKGVTVKPVLAGESALAGAIDRSYGIELSVDGILREIQTGEVDLTSLGGDTSTFSNPMARLVHALLTDAVKHEASDMHVNPMSSFVQIRYRIDGVLREARILERSFLSGLVVRLKVMSGMNIAESRMPQDGHFSAEIANASIDFRVSVQPTIHGENVVLRILNRHKGLLSLDNLGLAATNLTAIQEMMGRPEGIILVTGPTGSGKTTTLYAMLSLINAKEKNIMTLEDPVEYPLDAILQTSVNHAANLDFASGVRSMLRQDPDIILVGEIRDADTAQMALRAAMTGHQVFSTLHANSAMAAIFRLLNIGLRPDMLAGHIIGIMAQRLVRKLCLQCKQGYHPDADGVQMLGSHDAIPTLYAAVGCTACDHTGYKGRVCVMEEVIIDDDFNDLISRNASQGEYRRLAQDKKLRTMADFGKNLILTGITSVAEISRVIGWRQ